MKYLDTRLLLVAMVTWDLSLHIYQLITNDYLIYFKDGFYDIFWTSFWGLFLILLLYELYVVKRQ